MSFKSVIGYGVLAQKEATYATASAFNTTTHAVQVSELPTLAINYVNDGARPNSPSTAGAQPFVSPTGRFAEINLVMEARGSGSAYTSTATTPPDMHALLQACGFSASYAAGAWTYQPEAVGSADSSVAVRLFAREEQYTAVGGIGTFTLASDGASPAVYTFDVSALMSGSVIDANVATINYNSTVPPKTENIALTLGTFGTAIVRGFTLTLGREINPRVNINQTDAHAGFASGRRDMTFAVTIETPATSSFDIYELQRNGTQFATSFTIGSVTGNKLTISLPTCQIIGISNAEDGAVSTSELTIKPSSLNGANDITITYN